MKYGADDNITECLRRIQGGSNAEQAANELWSVVHDELRKLARVRLRGQSDGGTLQATALVHEAYLRLVRHDPGHGDTPSEWKDRVHFFAVAATAMRQILSNHVRDKRADKRQVPSGSRVTLAIVSDTESASQIDLMALHDALTQLSELDPTLARVVELRFFAGMSFGEIAHVMDVSERTVERHWRTARAWLSGRLRETQEP
ncbi:MAG: ECF-type sigma factor [Planctomycetota bacterium]